MSTEPPSLSEKDRREQNSLAFLDVGQLGTLRPVSYWTLETLRLLDLMGEGAREYSTLDADGKRDWRHVFLFVQSAPVPSVARAVRRYVAEKKLPPPVTSHQSPVTSASAAWENFVCGHVEPHLATLGAEARESLVEQLDTLGELAATKIDAEPPSAGRRERPPPNS